MLDYAKSQGIPVWTPVKLLDFLKAKDEARFNDIMWSANKLSFTIQSDYENTNLLSIIVPYTFKGKRITSLTADTITKPFTVKTIKGLEYAMFLVKPGNAYNITVQYTH